MTLEQAVLVLNRQKHRGRSCWGIGMSRTVSPQSAPFIVLFEFEAIAVAEKYEREKLGPAFYATSAGAGYTVAGWHDE